VLSRSSIAERHRAEFLLGIQRLCNRLHLNPFQENPDCPCGDYADHECSQLIHARKNDEQQEVETYSHNQRQDESRKGSHNLTITVSFADHNCQSI